jgi:hypothetical protein
MANTLIVSENLLTRAVVTASSYHTAYPPSQLCDGQGSTPFRHSVAAANDYIQIDLDTDSSGAVVGTRYRDGGFEAASLTLGGWTSTCVGAGNTAAVDAAQFMSGAKSVKLTLAHTAAGEKASAVKVLDNLPSGQRRNAVCALRGDGTVFARARLYIPETAQYVTSAGALTAVGAAAVDVWTRSTAVFAAQAKVSFTLPTYAACGRERLSLWLIAIVEEAANTGAAWVDDFFSWPSADTLLEHGHRLTVAGPVVLRWLASDTGAFAGEETTVESSITIVENRLYHHETVPSDLRYHRIQTVGTNWEAGSYGELALGQAATLLEGPQYPMRSTRQLPQIRTEGEYGGMSVVRLGNIASEVLEFRWQFESVANREQFIREMERRTCGGACVCWLIPRDDEALVVFGRLQDVWTDSRTTPEMWLDAVVRMTEEPYPRWP